MPIMYAGGRLCGATGDVVGSKPPSPMPAPFQGHVMTVLNQAIHEKVETYAALCIIRLRWIFRSFLQAISR